MENPRQWMVTHDWMVKGNRQSEWIEKRENMHWMAFYSGALGGGLFLVSLFFNNLWGMLIGWLIVTMLKGILHFLVLGKPTRFWRMVIHSRTSWLSRGLMFVFGFAGLAFIQMALSYFLPEQTVLIMIMKVLSGFFALCVVIYPGMILNRIKGVPFWDLSFLPLLFAVCGILGGFGMTVALGAFSVKLNMNAAEIGSRIMLIVNVLLIALYLFIAFRREGAGKQSVLLQVRGSVSPYFWFGIILLGIVIPAIIVISSIFFSEAAGVLILGTICEILGGAILYYCVLKSGIYNPIFLKDSLKRGPTYVRT